MNKLITSIFVILLLVLSGCASVPMAPMEQDVKAKEFVPAQDREDWQIRDPKGKGLEFFREVREDIRDEVERLIDRIRPSK